MDPLTPFFTWQVFIYGIAIYGVTRFFRGLAETYRPTLVKNQIWEDVVLPIVPVALGALLAHWKGFPFPTTLTEWTLRSFLGGVVGGLSGLTYRALKAIVKKQWGIDVSIRPPPGPIAVKVAVPPNDPLPCDETQKTTTTVVVEQKTQDK